MFIPTVALFCSRSEEAFCHRDKKAWITKSGVLAQGFDFAFLRRSQLYNECSEQTKYKWDSQYVGGNTLAVCNGKTSSSATPMLTDSTRNGTDWRQLVWFLFPEATLQIGGAKTAYFSKNQTCLATKSSSQLHNDILSTFINELRSNNIKGEVQQTCLVCGDQWENECENKALTLPLDEPLLPKDGQYEFKTQMKVSLKDSLVLIFCNAEAFNHLPLTPTHHGS